jgi:type IV secretory pathway VirB2 component (pilin)
VLIPLALFWFVMLGAMEVAADNGWNRVAIVPIAIGVLLAGSALLLGANRSARTARERDEVAV